VTSYDHKNTTLVVFVHGLWMTGPDMWWLRRNVSRHGYRVRQFSYPSMRCDVQQNAARLNVFLQQQSPEFERIHLVGHSLGGLVIRQLLHDFPAQKPGRIVTLGTPHNGSAIAHLFNRHRLGRLLLGKSALCGLLGGMVRWSVTREIGVIAGTKDHGIGRACCGLQQPNDGTVAVAETRLNGANDHIQLPVAHSGMLLSGDVARQVAFFLARGHFNR
jgi:triacylglycerol esterase/lipase EstA (alpha/beta hydrolase family)